MSQTTNTGRFKAGSEQTVLRTQLGRARGLGAARTGTGAWWAERVTSVALLPLTVWFVIVALRLAGDTRAAVAHYFASPVNAALMLATVLLTFHHTQLGLQVVIEDYVHAERLKVPAILAIKALAALLAIASAVAVLKLAFTG